MVEKASISHYGAINEVIWSKHVYTTRIDGKPYRIWLDMWKWNNLYDRNIFPTLDTLIISHAHIDHCGDIPAWYSLKTKWKYHWNIYTTELTKQAIRIALYDGLKIDTLKWEQQSRYMKKEFEKAIQYIQNFKNNHHDPQTYALEATKNWKTFRWDIELLKNPQNQFDAYKEFLNTYHIKKKEDIQKWEWAIQIWYYNTKTLKKILKLFKASWFDKEILLKKWDDNSLSVKFIPAWHILWSAQILIKDKKFGNFIYTWDIGRWKDPLYLPSPQICKENIHTLIMESTYGENNHPEREKALQEMMEKIQWTKWNILIPTLALNRLQDILQYLLTPEIYYKYGLNKKKIRLDGVSARAFTKIFINDKKYAILKENQDKFERMKKLNKTEIAKIMKRKNNIILTPNGMLVWWPVQKYLPHIIEWKDNLLLLVSYQAVSTPWKQILERKYPGQILCDVYHSRIWSSHGDQWDLIKLVQETWPKQVILVHGSWAAKHTLKEKIPLWKVYIPQENDTYYINPNGEISQEK